MKSLPKLSSLQGNQPIYNIGLHIPTVSEITLPLLFIRSYIYCFDLLVICNVQCMGYSRGLWTTCNEILVCVTKYFVTTLSLIGYRVPSITFRNYSTKENALHPCLEKLLWGDFLCPIKGADLGVSISKYFLPRVITTVSNGLHSLSQKSLVWFSPSDWFCPRIIKLVMTVDSPKFWLCWQVDNFSPVTIAVARDIEFFHACMRLL
jgi:hypothetical protein